MANSVVPEAKEALNKFKMEAASEVCAPLHIENQKMPYLCGFRDTEKFA